MVWCVFENKYGMHFQIYVNADYYAFLFVFGLITFLARGVEIISTMVKNFTERKTKER